MINKLKSNKPLYAVLKKFKILLWLFGINILQFFNILRKSACSKSSIRCEYDIKNKNYKYTLLGKDTPMCCLTHLYEITKDITSKLNKEKIDYFIMYGTLLGQVRHNKTFIPWDTDVDIVVMKKEKEKVSQLLKGEFSNIYNIIDDNEILKINYSEFNHLHIDIYFWEEENGILIDSLNDYWIKNRLKIEDVFPLVESKLYNLDIKVPRNSIKVLKNTYGEDCLEKAFKKYAFKNKSLKTFREGKINAF